MSEDTAIKIAWYALASICLGFGGAFCARGYLDHFWLGYVLGAKWLLIGGGVFVFALERHHIPSHKDGR